MDRVLSLSVSLARWHTDVDMEDVKAEAVKRFLLAVTRREREAQEIEPPPVPPVDHQQRVFSSQVQRAAYRRQEQRWLAPFPINRKDLEVQVDPAGGAGRRGGHLGAIMGVATDDDRVAPIVWVRWRPQTRDIMVRDATTGRVVFERTMDDKWTPMAPVYMAAGAGVAQYVGAGYDGHVTVTRHQAPEPVYFSGWDDWYRVWVFDIPNTFLSVELDK